MIDSILFFFILFALLGWLACESDIFAAGPHTSSSSSALVASPHSSPSPNRRERRALARSRSPPPPPAWSRPGSLLRPPPPPFRHVPAAGRHDTFLLPVGTVESFGAIERVFDPVNGWKWAPVRGGRPVSPRLFPLPVSRPVTPVPVLVAPLVPAPASVLAPSPPVAQQTPAVLPPPASGPPRSLSVLEMFADIPSTPQPLFPRPAVPAPQPQLQPTGTVQATVPNSSASGSLAAALLVPRFLSCGVWPLQQLQLAPPVSGFFFALLPSPPSSPSVPIPAVVAASSSLRDPVPSAPSAGASQPQSQVELGSAPPPPASSGFASGFGFGFGSGSAPVFGGGLDFSPSSSSSAPASRRGRSGRARGSSRPIYQRVDNIPRTRQPDDDDNDDHGSKRETAWQHGFEEVKPTYNGTLWKAGFRDVCGNMNRLLDLNAYLPGSTLASFENNLNLKENGLRTLANLLRWQFETRLPQPAGGSQALADLITIPGLVDGLGTGFVDDNGGRQQEFNGGDFLKWARAWRYCRRHFWELHRAALERQLAPAVFQQLQGLVARHEGHWRRFLV